MKQRIWELDAIRGIFMIYIILFHLMYDLVYLFDVVDLTTPFSQFLYQMGNDWGGTPFLIISGLCVTFGRHPVRRGLQVIGGGMLITLVTACMYWFGFVGKGIIIYFGVLHCIGTCMLLWTLFKKLPTPALLILGLVMAAVGLYLKNNAVVDFPWLIPLGIPSYGFVSSDYFPLLPNLGYFLVGAAIGRKLYPTRQTLLPQFTGTHPIIRFFRFFGQHSLLLYLVHQPVLAALVYLGILLF